MLGDGTHRVEVARHVLEVHGDDRGGPIGDLRFEIGGIETERVIDLGKYRHRARSDNRVHRRHEGERRHDHFVAAPDTQRRECAAQRGRPVRNGDRVTAAEQCARGAFELRDRAVSVIALVAEQ